jgi:ankyrin repeat protein
VDPTEFIQLVTQGDAGAALSALQREPNLAAARNPQGVSIVCLAVYHRRADLAAALAGMRTDLDIFEAACVGDLECVERLASSNPGSVNAVSPDGFSPVGYAAFFGHVALLQALLRRGGEVNTPSRNAMRVCPLHSAAAHADQTKAVELARLLLAAGADPNPQQQAGYTALHEAAQNDKLALIALLLRHGADPELENDHGVRPADLARAKGHTEALRLLEPSQKNASKR